MWPRMICPFYRPSVRLSIQFIFVLIVVAITQLLITLLNFAATDASLIAGISDDLLFSVIGLVAAIILLALMLLTCFCLLKRKINKLSKELRLMRDEDGTTTASDGLRLRLATM